MIAFDIIATLEQAGAAIVGPAVNVRDAIALVSDNQFDVAVLDFRLGYETSTPIARQLDKRSSPYFFYCGSAEEVARLFPAAAIVHKPGHMHQIVDEILAQTQ